MLVRSWSHHRILISFFDRGCGAPRHREDTTRLGRGCSCCGAVCHTADLVPPPAAVWSPRNGKKTHSGEKKKSSFLAFEWIKQFEEDKAVPWGGDLPAAAGRESCPFGSSKSLDVLSNIRNSATQKSREAINVVVLPRLLVLPVLLCHKVGRMWIRL